MSDLPEIPYTKVINKHLATISELISQKASLEVLAEALRDERDLLQQEINTLKFEQENAAQDVKKNVESN